MTWMSGLGILEVSTASQPHSIANCAIEWGTLAFVDLRGVWEKAAFY